MSNAYFYDQETADNIDWQHPLILCSAIIAAFVALLVPPDKVWISVLFLLPN